MSTNIIIIIAAIVVVASLAICESNGVAPRLQDARADKCKKLGPQCSDDRREILLCTEINKPGKVVKNCDSEGGKRCSEKDGNFICVEAEPDDNKPVKFFCTADGEFPDPLDCKYTYKCSKGKEYPTERCYCDQNGFIYPDMDNDHPCFALKKCPRDEFECQEGKHGEFTANGEGTGVCYFCRGNDTSTSYDCREKLENVVRMSKFRSAPVEKKCVKLESPPPTKPTAKPRPPECEPPRCTDPRCFYWRYNAECDCFYYECDRRMIPVKHACPYGWHYVHNLQRCVKGLCDRNCPNCD